MCCNGLLAFVKDDSLCILCKKKQLSKYIYSSAVLKYFYFVYIFLFPAFKSFLCYISEEILF